MTKTFCAYDGSREETLVGYLYDDLSPSERSTFEQHVASCAWCREELHALGALRADLGKWAAPEPVRGVGGRKVLGSRRAGFWQRAYEAPAWARAVAAIFILGVALGAANVRVEFHADGFSMRTGWLATPSADARTVARAVEQAMASDTAAWREEMASVERRLRDQMRLEAPASAAGSRRANEETLRQVRSLVSDSERRQQSELALRVAQAVQDLQEQRTADLRRIERTLGLMDSSNRAMIVRQDQMLNNLAIRVSQGR